MKFSGSSRIVVFGVTASFGLLAIGRGVEAHPVKPVLSEGADQGWMLVERLSDEFDGPKIDHSKWLDDPEDWGPWSWEPDNVGQQNGKLGLTIRYKPHTAMRRAPGTSRSTQQQLYYTSGILRSKDYQTYGYFEARLKGVPTYPGSSPAFWIYSQRDSNEKHGFDRSEGAVTYAEVDIVELQQGGFVEEVEGRDGPEVMDMNLHMRMIEKGKEIWKRPGGFPAMTKNRIEAGFDPRDDFHIYGARVTPEEVIWYLDGVEVARKPNLYWHLPMHVTLSLGLRSPHVTYRECPDGFWRCPVPGAATKEGYPSTMEVDWVRTWHMPGEAKLGTPDQITAAVIPATNEEAPSRQYLPDVDENGDGKLSGAEFTVHMTARDLQMRDADRNGAISRSEWLGQDHGSFRQITIDQFNKDNDAVMSLEEIGEVYLWVFRNRDKNRDGFLSMTESPSFLLAK